MNKSKKKRSSFSCFEAVRPLTLNPLKNLKRMCRDVKCAYQRIRYGYCFRDVWNIDIWFLNVVPNMLENLKEDTCGYPPGPDSFSQAVGGVDDESNGQYESGMKKWKDTLSQMIFLLREANEDTCTLMNTYKKEYDKAFDEFGEKYGHFGEKLKKPEEKEEERKKGYSTLYTPSDVPEYKEICDLYFNEESALDRYRSACKDEGLELFKKWFWNLWD